MHAELEGNEIWVECSFAENKLVGSVPGMRYHKGKNKWRVAATWTACLTMRAVYGKHLQLGPDLIEWARLRAEHEQTMLRLGTAMHTPMPRLDERLFAYQGAGVEFLTEAGYAILGDEPGLGKTAQTISAVRALHDSGDDVLPVLVVCPNSLKKNWEKEIGQWWPEQGNAVSVVDGTATARRKSILDADADGWTVINWESARLHSRISGYGSIRLKSCAKCGGIENPRAGEEYKGAVTEAKCEVHRRELNTKGYKTVIVDEGHRAKDPNAKQTRAMWSLLHAAKYRYILTGTPIADNVGDIWSLLHGLDPDAFPLKSKFLDVFAETSLNFFGGFEVLGLKPSTADVFRRILAGYMRRTPKALALPDLPEKMPPQYRYVKLKPQQAKQYRQMKEGMLTLLDNGMPLTADSAVTQFGRLRQFASATGSYNAETGKVMLADPSSKIDDLLEFLADEQKPVVVAAASRQLLELAGKRLEGAKYRVGYVTGAQTIDEREVAVREFQAGKLDAILINSAGAEGITLTKADTMVFLEQFDSNVMNKQMEDRIHRIGSEGHSAIRIICIVAEDTIETNREYNLYVKEERFQEIVQDEERIRRMLA